MSVDDAVRLQKGQTIQLAIEDLNRFGEGVGHHQGMAIFVGGALPGERIEACLTAVKSRFARAVLLKITEPSPNRVVLACPVAESCGGCALQHASYDAQLSYKEKWVRDSLIRIGGFADPPVKPVVSSADMFRYRNKAQFQIGRCQGEEKKSLGCRIGFYEAKSHQLIDQPDCLLQAPPAQVIAEAVREFVKTHKIPVYDQASRTGQLSGLTVRTAFATDEVMVILNVVSGKDLPNTRPLIEKINRTLPAPYELRSLILQVEPINRTNRMGGGKNYGKTPGKIGTKIPSPIILAGKATIRDCILGYDFEISPQSFYQINPAQTEVLYSKVREMAIEELYETQPCSARPFGTIYDLYCGVGTIGLLLSDLADRVIGIESVKSAVLDANRNATINGIVNAEFVLGRAETELPKLMENLKKEALHAKPDLIILDPPRAGCAPELLEAIIQSGIPNLIYVSCDPATLARDLRQLATGGYDLKEAQPVDMFAMTGHVETVVLMSRNG